MTGSRNAFAELDPAVYGTVRFGDGSLVNIEGRGTVLFVCKFSEHRALTGVYYIPHLTANIISIGQLDDAGSKVDIEHDILRLFDPDRQLLAKVRRAPNRLYYLNIDIARPVCLAACESEHAWRWHTRYGHLNFQALRRLSSQSMVRGLPPIDHVNQLCDVCLAGKQKRTSFPQQSAHRANERLELVHGDICGPIEPTTPGGKRYFLLLIDDMSRYMWLTLITSKDEAVAAIKKFKAHTELERGRKLKVLRTDREGEFTSIEFGEYMADQGVHRQLTALTRLSKMGLSNAETRAWFPPQHDEGKGRSKDVLG